MLLIAAGYFGLALSEQEMSSLDFDVA